MKRVQLFCFFVAILTFLNNTEIYAQAMEKTRELPKLAWINLGAGISLSEPIYNNGNYNGNFSVAFNLTLKYKKYCYQLGFNHLLADEDEVNNIYAGIGKCKYGRFYTISGFIGPGYILTYEAGISGFSSSSSGSREIRYTTFGIIENIQLMLKPFENVGIGLDIIGNINPEKSRITSQLALHLFFLKIEKPNKNEKN